MGSDFTTALGMNSAVKIMTTVEISVSARIDSLPGTQPRRCAAIVSRADMLSE